MPRRHPPEEPSPRVLAILARSRARPGAPVDPPVDPPWVRAVEDRYVPTREEVAGPGTPGLHGPRRSGRGVLVVPEVLRLARWAPSRTAVAGALAAVLVAVGVFGLRVAWARAESPPSPVGTAPPRTSAVRAASDASVPSGAPGSAAPSPAALVVHVVGQVVRPGIVRLPLGSRVVDAVAAAGGARTGADLAAVNLARLVVDGEQIRVPKPGEPFVVGGSPGAGGTSASAARVSLNSADLASLDTLPGVGPVLAQRIVDWRAEHGRFTSVDELGEVSGIGEKLLAQLRPKVTL